MQVWEHKTAAVWEVNGVRSTQRRETEEKKGSPHSLKYLRCRLGWACVDGADERQRCHGKNEAPLSSLRVDRPLTTWRLLYLRTTQQVDLKTCTSGAGALSAQKLRSSLWFPAPSGCLQTPAMGEWTILERLLEAAVQQHSTMIGRWVGSALWSNTWMYEEFTLK